MAYFTDPMSDEFRKALEKVLKEIEKDPKKKKERRVRASRKNSKPRVHHLSKKQKEELR